MKKHRIPTFILFAYSAILIRMLVFKDVPVVKSGAVTLKFGGTNGNHPPNFVPFTTIVPYLVGKDGLLIGGLNLLGNIALLVPIGFLVPFIYPNIKWKKVLVVAVASGLVLEGMQAAFHVGIFDIDDVILNGFGVMVGYWAFIVLIKSMPSAKSKGIAVASAVLVTVIAGVVFYQVAVEPKPHQEVTLPSGGGDLCGGTGGTGQIVSLGDNTFVIKSRAGKTQLIKIAYQATIKNSAGKALTSDLKMGDRVTIVGEPNHDGSETASTVLVCN